MGENTQRDSTTARYISPHDADVKTLCKQECGRIVHSKRCRYALIPLALFLIVLVVYVIFDYPPEPLPICVTAPCIRTGWNLKQTMNLEEKPCDDFYSYVCGGNWTKQREAYDQSDENRRKKFVNELRDLLAKNTSQADPLPVNHAKRMFKVCTSKVGRIVEGYGKLDQFYARFGLPKVPSVLRRSEGWIMDGQQFDWVDSVAKIKRFLGLNVLIGIKVNSNRLTLGYPTLPRDWDYPTSYRPKVENVTQLLQSSDIVGTNMIQVAVAINTDLKVTDSQKKFQELGTQVQDFHRLLPNRSTTATDQVTISVRELDPVLQRYLDSLFEDLPDAKPLDSDTLLVSDQQYLTDLIGALSDQQPEQIELYIWGLVSTFLIRHRFSHVGLEEDCVQQVNQLMKPAMSYMLADNNYRDYPKQSIQLMLNHVRSELKEPSGNSTTRILNARFESLELILNPSKIEHFYKEFQVGDNNLENWINGLGFVSTNRLKTWRTAIEPQDYIPMTILQNSFRNLGLESLNYGSIGVALSHELLLGLETHQNRAKCFTDDRSTLDNEGLKLAWRAYRRLNPETELALPGEYFTSEQAFFVSYAWHTCSGERSDSTKTRINEAVRELDTFSDAFECPTGSAMNPEEKCGVV